MLFECPEKSSFNLRLNLKDDQGNDLLPINGLSWWVGNPRKDEPVILKTEVQNPEHDSVITIPAEANICDGRRDEERFVIVRVESGVHVKHKQFDYVVTNLGLVPYEEE